MKPNIVLSVMLPALFAVSALSSCVRESLDQPADCPSGPSREMTVNLSFPASGTFAPGTKSSPEESLRDVYVLAFSQKQGETAKSYRYRSRASLASPAGESANSMNFTVLLKTSEEGEVYDFVFVANAGKEIDAALQNVMEGESKENVLKAVTFSTSEPWDVAKKPVPLSGQLVNKEISDGQKTSSLGNVKLYRSMARIDISLSDEADNLDINEVTLYGLYDNSRVIPDCFVGETTDIQYDTYEPSYADGAGKSDQTFVKDGAVAETGFAGMIHVGESPVTEQLTVLLKAKYTDNDDPGLDGEYYYKVTVKDPAMEAFKRNWRYTLTITGTRGPGFTTAEEALKSVDMIDAVLEATDEYDMNDITSDGVNQLAVDVSEIQFYKDGGVSAFSVYTDYSRGWKIDVGETASGWIKVSSTGEGNGMTNLEGTAGVRSKVYVHVGELSQDFTGSQRQASFYIVAGRLRKRMTVIQENRTHVRIVLSPETMEFGKKTEVDRKVDISVIPADAGTIKLKSIEGDITFATAPEEGSLIPLDAGNASVQIRPGENDKTGTRRSWLTFILEKDGVELSTAILSVVQRDYDIIYTSSIMDGQEGFLEYIPAAGGSTSLKVTSEYSWRMRYWTVTADGGKNDEGNDRVYQAGNSEYVFDAPENSASWKRRDFVFYPESEDGSNSLGIDSFIHQQDYPDPYVKAEAAVTTTVLAETGIDETSVSVYSNCPWKVSGSDRKLGLEGTYTGGADYADVPATADQMQEPQSMTLSFKAYNHPSEDNGWLEDDLSKAGEEVTGSVTFSSDLTHEMTGTAEEEVLKQTESQLKVTRTMPSLWKLNKITKDGDETGADVGQTAALFSWKSQGFTADVSLNSSTTVAIGESGSENPQTSVIEFEGEHYLEHGKVKFEIPSNGWADADGSRTIREMDITLSGNNLQETSSKTFKVTQPSCWLASIALPPVTESSAPLMPQSVIPDLKPLSTEQAEPSFMVSVTAAGNFETLPLYIAEKDTDIDDGLLPVLEPFTNASLSNQETPDEGYEKYSGTYLLSVPYAKSWDAHGKTFSLVYNTCHTGQREPLNDKPIGDITLKGYYVQNAAWAAEDGTQTFPEEGEKVSVRIQGYWPDNSVYYKVGETGALTPIKWKSGDDADNAEYEITIPSTATSDDQVKIIRKTGTESVIATLEFSASIPKEAVLFEIKEPVEFYMGYEPSSSWDTPNDNPGSSYSGTSIKHKVRLTKSFYLSKYEVTNEEYCRFLNKLLEDTKKLTEEQKKTTPYLDPEAYRQFVWYVPEGDNTYSYPLVNNSGYSKVKYIWDEEIFKVESGYEQYPMEGVYFYGALKYAEWKGAMLPTEAQWEYAASLDVDPVDSYELVPGVERPVQEGPEGAMGLHGMVGNGKEYTSCYENSDTGLQKWCFFPYEYNPNIPPYNTMTFTQWVNNYVEEDPQGADLGPYNSYDFIYGEAEYFCAVLKGYPDPYAGKVPMRSYRDLEPLKYYLYDGYGGYDRCFRLAWPVAE